MASQIRQDVIRALHLHRQFAVLFLHLFTAHILRSVIRDRGSFDDDILLIRPGGDLLEHLPRRRDRDDIDKLRFLHCCRSAHERDLSASAHTHCCDGIAHFPGRVIRDEAYRIYRLLCRSCRHQNLQALHVLLTCSLPEDILQQELRLRHLAGARIAAGKVAFSRRDHLIAVLFQDLQVVLHDRILVHVCVHRRCDDLPASARHDCSCQHIIRDTVGDLPDDISACRCDHHHISLFRQGYVLYAELKVSVKRIHKALISRQCLECDRIDEIRSILRHQYVHIRIKLFERTGKIGYLVRGDASRDCKQDCFSLQHIMPPFFHI